MAKKAIKAEVTPVPGKQAGGPPAPFPIVGIGASAGGLSAIIKLLENLPVDLGMAYVIVQHLSPDHESILPEILQRRTAMTVQQVEDGMKVEPDNLYVIPPDKLMSLIDGHLRLSPRLKVPGPFHTIDFFLTTLAEIYCHEAIAVILSGSASDGTLGVKAVKAAGGITFAQDESAEFSGMPGSAIESGFIDVVLPPEGIAQELAALTKHPYTASLPEQMLEGADSEVLKIHAMLLKTHGVDFSLYKQTTILRRIARRTALARLRSLDAYVKMLRESPAELEALYRDLLINVTSFFRDPALFLSLQKQIFPKLLEGRKAANPLRIWIPACATGEEAYSFAIALFEQLGIGAISTAIQIFATDLSEWAIDKARAGIYTKAMLEHMPATRLRRFFVKLNGHYQIIKAIRDVCVFATHNLLKDPPFSRMDIVSCQNVLIYFEPAPQRKLVRALHYALNPGGFLILGKSETVGAAGNLFTQIDHDLRIYKKVDVPGHQPFDFSFRPSHIRKVQLADTMPAAPLSNSAIDWDLDRETDRLLLSRYVPPSVVVNKEGHIMRFNGSMAAYLQPASGKASLHLLKMVRDELVFELRSLLQRARKEGLPQQKEGVRFTNGPDQLSLTLEVTPIKSPGPDSYFLVLFHKGGVALPDRKPLSPASRRADAKDKYITSLESELAEAGEGAKRMSEDAEEIRQELQSAAEEILSSNEELQSINEELETSKEELQSTNEELSTINDELRLRASELQEASDYTMAIIETMREALVVLHQDGRIRSANKSFYSTFRLAQEYTEGIHIYDIADGVLDIPELRHSLSGLSSRKGAFRAFEASCLIPGVGRKELYFRASRMEGDIGRKARILVVIQDITERKQAEDALRSSEERFRLLIESAEDYAIVTMTPDNLINSWNAGAERMFGWTEAEIVGQSGSILFTPEDRKRAVPQQEMQTALAEGRASDERYHIRKDGSRFYVSGVMVPLKNQKLHGFAKIARDLTEAKRTADQLRESEARLRIAIEAAELGTWNWDLLSNEVVWNDRHYLLFGMMPGHGPHSPETFFAHVHAEDREWLRERVNQSVFHKKSYTAEFRILPEDGGLRWMSAYWQVTEDTNGTPARLSGVTLDITEQKASEQRKEEFLGVASHELKTPVTSIKAYAEMLKELLEESDHTAAAELAGKLDKQIDRITQLIRDLLDATRMTEGRLTLQESQFDLTALVTETMEAMQHTTKHHILIIEDGFPAVTVYADRARIGQVLTNLLSNAIKYSPDSNEIFVSATHDAAMVNVCVRDSGVGIGADVQAHLFDRFYRADDPDISTYPGLGLGLYISAEIVRQHGGELGVKSTKGKGATFCFTLPLDRKNDAEADRK